MSDPVNHPAHYTYGKYEVIDVIEDADICRAPALQDAKKARFYLDRLIEKLEPTDKME